MQDIHHMDTENSLPESNDQASSNFFRYVNVPPSRTKESGQDESESYYSDSEDDPNSPYIRGARIFMAISVISAILLLVFEVYIFAVINVHKKKLNSDARYTELSIYLALFIFACIFQVVLSFIGLKSKNLILLTMLCAFYVCMLIYTGIQYDEISRYVRVVLTGAWRGATTGVNIAAIAVIGVTMVLQILLIYCVLRKHVRWINYKKIGADPKIKQLFTVYQIHRSLLILDFFFFLGFTVQFIVIMVENKSSVEFILTIIVLPVTIILLIWCDFAVTKELIWATVTAIVILSCGCAYVLFKIIRLFTKYTSAYHYGIHPGSYFPGRKSLVTFGVLTLILLASTIALELFLIVNYNRNLKDTLEDSYLNVPWKRTDVVKRESFEID